MEDSEEAFDDQLLQRSMGQTGRRRARLPAFAALHGAYHVLNRRMAMELRDHQLNPSEAVVLQAIRRYPQATVAVVRQLTGLRASTLDSMLDRLGAPRELLMRESPRDLRGEVVLAAIGSADLMTYVPTAALGRTRSFGSTSRQRASSPGSTPSSKAPSPRRAGRRRGPRG